MSTKQIESRLAALEKAVAELQKRLPANDRLTDDPKTQRHWWIEDAGRFKDDPDFEEVIRLGKKYRDSQNPYKKKRTRKRKRS